MSIACANPKQGLGLMIGLTEQERREALSFWAGLVSFVALFYLTGSSGNPLQSAYSFWVLVSSDLASAGCSGERLLSRL